MPENRLRVYEVRDVIQLLADEDSVLELRREFGVGMVTAFIRIEGQPIGLIANNPKHLGGAIDAPAADKAARFMQLCDAFDIPIVSLVRHARLHGRPRGREDREVRHVSRLFVTAAHLRVPFFSVVLRKGYGLGAQAMAGGGFQRLGVLHCVVAHRRVRRHGPGRLCAAGLSQGDGSDRRPGRAAEILRRPRWHCSYANGKASFLRWAVVCHLGNAADSTMASSTRKALYISAWKRSLERRLAPNKAATASIAEVSGKRPPCATAGRTSVSRNGLTGGILQSAAAS